MDNQVVYDRQGSLSLGSLEHPIHIIGCGGVGTWAALMLAMAGAEHLHLYDNDVLEESNLNRLPYAMEDIGQEKTTLLAKALRHMRNVEITHHGLFNPLLHKFGSRSSVICAVDTMRDRQAIYAACQESGAFYIDVGAESHTCTVSDSPADWSIVEDRQGYFTPIWVAPVVMAASLAVARVVSGARGTLLADLSTETIRSTEDTTLQRVTDSAGHLTGIRRIENVAQEQETRGQVVGGTPGEPIRYEPGGIAGPVLTAGTGVHNDTQQPRVQRRRRTVHERLRIE